MPLPPDLKTVIAIQAKSQVWPELVPLDEPDPPRLDIAHIPAWAGAFARELCRFTETPRELAAGMVLAACATAAARRLSVRVRPGYVEPCNLWVIVALESGNRKSAVQRAAVAPLLAWERDQAADLAPEIARVSSKYRTMVERAKAVRASAVKSKDRLEAEVLAEAAAKIEAELPEIPIPPQLWTSDATPERLGSLLADHGETMAWLSSEGGIFELLRGRYSNGIPNLDLVLKAHSGDAERVDRGSRPPVFLRSPRLSMGLSPQPEVLRGLAGKAGFRGRGLLARFLFLLPKSHLGSRSLETHEIPEGVRSAYAAGVRAMLDWEPAFDDYGDERPYFVDLTPAAGAEHLDFARMIEEQMRPGGDMEHHRDWAGKAPGAAARLAGVLHAIEHAHGQPWDHPITLETMTAALELMGVITRHTVGAFNVMGSDPEIEAARRVWVWVSGGRRAEFRLREAQQALKGTFPRVIELRRALEVLEERGYLEVIEPPRDGPGRPPSPTVVVRPDIAEAW